MKNKNKRYYPCPICKGRGDFNDGDYVDWQQVSADTPCSYCDAEGMIEIGGAIQKRNKTFKLGMEYLNKHYEEGKTYSYKEIMKFGEKLIT